MYGIFRLLRAAFRLLGVVAAAGGIASIVDFIVNKNALLNGTVLIVLICYIADNILVKCIAEAKRNVNSRQTTTAHRATQNYAAQHVAQHRVARRRRHA